MQDKKHKTFSKLDRKPDTPIEEIINECKIKIIKKLAKKVKRKELINIEYSKALKIRDYKIKSIIKNKTSDFEPKYVIPSNFDISDEIYNPYYKL